MTKYSVAANQAKYVLETVVVVVSLVHTIMDTFGSTSDLYRKLKKKQEKVKEDVELLKGRHDIPPRRDSEEHSYQTSRRRRRKDRENDYSDSDEESIDTSGPLIRREYERGYHHLGHKFAVGDCEYPKS